MANEYIRGQTVRLYTDPPFRNAAGTPTDPTTVTIRVTDPLGATTDYTLAAAQVVKDTSVYPNGSFYYDLSTIGTSDAQCNGYWIYAPIGTGPVTAAEKNTFILKSEKTRT